ncbi:hypothetical protein HMPREF1008_00166 [Olsenella sp. oral taxon 809 str. F0356]|uniref:Na+/H+ antiporter NhaC family protein n=1 Tax=Olsenella sp. oral taxon 809 TaxID=661086 RepID=UPI000231F28C|nr:Na+/H+ antiporter NhaC family protein [Olsenella sp. oral taxon 809]EHF02521.1 hypothetical protein HMPREF1008_00166 [Olsenella sp. oral taxon 809 str. F0356]
MAEALVLAAFALSLAVGIAFGLSLLVPLACGLALFVGYGLHRGHRLGELLRVAARGPLSIGRVLVLFVVIGMLTASWRAAGTIPAVTCLSVRLVSPSTLPLASFVLCGLMSTMTGSSFAASATVGVVCMTIATAMRADVLIVGGAIISGSFLGDRCSPMSSTAMLVSTITHSSLRENLGRMLRISVVPVVACALIYAALGPAAGGAGMAPSFRGSFATSFDLSWYVLAPIALVLVLSLAKLSVLRTMLASLASALLLCVFAQHVPLGELPGILLFGFRTSNLAIGRMVNGGGVLSMTEIALIVAVASSYSGLFEETGLLRGIRAFVRRLAGRTTPFAGVLVTSVVTACIACDQVVSLMLTAQLCDEIEGDGSALALDLSSSAAIIPAVIPWTTSCVGLCAFVGMPTGSAAYAFLCMLIPLWTLVVSLWQRRHPGFALQRGGRVLGLDARDDARLIGHEVPAKLAEAS